MEKSQLNPKKTNMKRHAFFIIAALLLTSLASLLWECQTKPVVGDLERNFVTPPDSVKPSCYWWWFYNLADKEGITRDLTEFKAKGMGSVMIVCTANGYDAGEMPHGPDFLSDGWRELYRYSLKEANRLGLKVGLNICGGWCIGGPWITQENSSRWLLQSEITLTGPQTFSGKLPLPAPKDGYDSEPQGAVPSYIKLPLDRVDYRDAAVIAFREADDQGTRLGSERMKSLPAKSNRKDASIFTPAKQVMIDPAIPWITAPGDRPIEVQDVIVLTDKVKADGQLDWVVPEGKWTIIRTGHRATGMRLNMSMPLGNADDEKEIMRRMDHPMPGSSDGWVIDWFSRESIDQHWAGMVKILIDDAGPLIGKTLTFLGTDSFEDGYPNWTPKVAEMFLRYRGYDPTPYLPVFRGRIVGSAEQSDRFLHDYRKTMADCMADNVYGYLSELASRHGIAMACEAGGPSWSKTICMDALKNLGRCTLPQGEFWTNYDWLNVSKQTASAAHIYGRPLALAEAFTSGEHWSRSPASLKPIGDRAFCDGINRFVFHTMTSQRPQDGKPGYEYGAGTHFNPNVTWWDQTAGSWLGYINRCQAMLQSGLFVADVLFYNGDGAPNLFDARDYDPLLPKGYDYDVCNAEVLLTRLSVKDRRLVLPDGMSYRLLVLPESTHMPVELVRKIRDLVEAGATIVGPKPESDPGLKNYPVCDAEVKKIATELWGACDGQQVKQQTFGKGRVFWGNTVSEILLADGVSPDFDYPGDAFIDFIHRTVDGTEIYFLANRKTQAATVEATFRVIERQPELWDPVSGQRRDLPKFGSKNGCTTVPLEFEPDGSMFVVFRKNLVNSKKRARNTEDTNANFPKLIPQQEISGPWTVHFDPQWFYPTDGLSGDHAKGLMVFDKLEDWTKRSEPAIKYFSGTAVYRKTFILADASAIRNPQSKIYLDLGTVKETAKVRLNGQDLGVVWCHPWRVEITGAIKPGENKLEIEVVNLWPNRLVGDSKLSAGQRRTRTNIQVEKVLSAGLLGPVTVKTEAPIPF
jgi:hypothetical protein